MSVPLSVDENAAAARVARSLSATPKSTSASAPGGVLLRDERLHRAPAGFDLDLHPAGPDVVPHRPVRRIGAVFIIEETVMDPSGGMPLLAWCIQIHPLPQTSRADDHSGRQHPPRRGRGAVYREAFRSVRAPELRASGFRGFYVCQVAAGRGRRGCFPPSDGESVTGRK
jgi:hypothetical protein